MSSTAMFSYPNDFNISGSKKNDKLHTESIDGDNNEIFVEDVKMLQSKSNNHINNRVSAEDVKMLHSNSNNGFNNGVSVEGVKMLHSDSNEGFNNGVYAEDTNMLHNNSSNGCNNGVSAEDVQMLHSKYKNGVSAEAVKKLHSKSVLVSDELTAKDLQSLFEDQICVLHIRNFIPQEVTGKLNNFLQEKGSEEYTHEVRNKDGSTELQYFGVNRFGRPLNSTYNDPTGESLKKYFADALPTMQAIRRAVHPCLSPIDKLRVELDELWTGKVNVATLNGKKTFCGIGRIMPASLSSLSAIQPHFDAVPTSYFPTIFKQFAANVYLNVPHQGGELEIWNVPPVDVSDENFTIPADWRSALPTSIIVKPGPGDLLLLNTRRPHAITKFAGTEPRTSVQTFIGLTKESDVILWV
ncbi:hypothetical protein JTE90_016611 [Oedothorax gibbosus]|uniref:Prolyl 4-hydroxylase alpha subunit Fe(2+) 2OG dioxygenase domain-containing protein n=1 Tax=Oedothorax gibbosus TaxID=931172 RepID=A0AAV6TLP1_9ARAC|nr:hypothetical protein JTE90_016611 [Oedothorax gibbosus]